MFWYKLPQQFTGQEIVSSLESVANRLGYECKVLPVSPEWMGGSMGFESNEKIKIQLVRKDQDFLKILYHKIFRDERFYFMSSSIIKDGVYSDIGFNVWRGPMDNNKEVRRGNKNAETAEQELEEIIGSI